MKKRALAAVLACMTVVAMGCGSTSTSDTAGTTETTAEAGTEADTETDAETSDEVITVRVAGTADYDPYTYVDENDNVTGFDIEVIKAIDAIAPEIECEYTYTTWDTLLPGLDADKFDVVSNQLGYTEERASMYLYPKTPFLFTGTSVISAADQPMDSYDDLAGKKVGAIVGSSFTTQMEQYLDEHPDAFTLEYLDGTLPQMLEEIANGRVDATMNDATAAFTKAELAGLSDKLYISDEIYDGGFIYFLFPQTEKGQQIADIFDKYLPELYYNGTLSALALEYLGVDSCVTSMPANGVFEEATLEEYQAAHPAE